MTTINLNDLTLTVKNQKGKTIVNHYANKRIMNNTLYWILFGKVRFARNADCSLINNKINKGK